MLQSTAGDTVEHVPQSGLRVWAAPPEGVWKINVDGAFCAENRNGAWGFVIRDHAGHPSIAGAGCIEVVAEALCAEAHACIGGLTAASSKGAADKGV